MLVRVDTQRAYELIHHKIITLELAPGAPVDEQALADEFGMGAVPIREALQLLAHDNLVEVTDRHGLYVADVSRPDLEQISETRIPLEALCARLAAARATEDDIAVLDSVRRESAATPPEDNRRLLELDHKFHQAVARAAHNRYLSQTLDHFFGLSQRLWYLVIQEIGYLPAAVGQHLDLVEAIRARDENRAEQIMVEHVTGFYNQVMATLMTGEQGEQSS